jgi:hypothetical protein
LPHAKIAPEVRDEVLADMNLALELFNGATVRLFDLFDWRYRWPRGLPKPGRAEVEEEVQVESARAGGDCVGSEAAAEVAETSETSDRRTGRRRGGAEVEGVVNE